jgi:hypothetical protein
VFEHLRGGRKEEEEREERETERKRQDLQNV